MIFKFTNKSKNFYLHMGAIFGSRMVEKVTGDRFYDDDNKEWFINFDKNYKPCAFLSISNAAIKNIYGEESKLDELLKNVYSLTGESIVPSLYKEFYNTAGFRIIGEKSKNFLIIRGGLKNEDI